MTATGALIAMSPSAAVRQRAIASSTLCCARSALRSTVRGTGRLRCGSRRPPRRVAVSSLPAFLAGSERDPFQRVDGGVQMALGQVEVDGGVLQPLMAISTGWCAGRLPLQQVGREAVPQRVRMDLLLQACSRGRPPAHVPDRLVGDGCSAPRWPLVLGTDRGAASSSASNRARR